RNPPKSGPQESRKIPRMRLAIACVVLTMTCACGGGGGTTTPPTASPQPTPNVGSCAIPIQAEGVGADAIERVPKAEATSDRRTRRGRVYEELWKHQAAVAARAEQRGVRPETIVPAATTEDIGQIAVVRDEGDLF